MRFLFTLNMPSAQGNSVHQLIVEHPAENITSLWSVLNDEIFIVGRQLYKKQNLDGPPQFTDRGEIIINSAHIGKVQEYIEYDREDAQQSKQREPLRPKFSTY